MWTMMYPSLPCGCAQLSDTNVQLQQCPIVASAMLHAQPILPFLTGRHSLDQRERRVQLLLEWRWKMRQSRDQEVRCFQVKGRKKKGKKRKKRKMKRKKRMQMKTTMTKTTTTMMMKTMLMVVCEC